MNPETKQQSLHGWYQGRAKRPPAVTGSGRREQAAACDKLRPPPSLLTLCRRAAPGQLRRAAVMHWIDLGADVDGTDAEGLTALMYIAKRGDLDLVRYLVGRGMRVNAACLRGFTALCWAAWYEHREVVYYLKSRGAGVHVPAALFAAASEGRVGTLRLMQQVGAPLRCGPLERGASGAPDMPADATSLLVRAAACGQLGVVQFLLQAPKTTSVKDRLRAVRAAVRAGHYRVASFLETGRDRPYFHVLRHVRWILERRAGVNEF